MGPALTAGCASAGETGTGASTAADTLGDTRDTIRDTIRDTTTEGTGDVTGGSPDGTPDASPSNSAVAGDGSAAETFETLPPVDTYVYPTAPGAVVAQISSRVPVGPAVPLLTVYGDGLVITGTSAGWFEGRIANGDIQLFLDEAESVGLLDDELSLRGPDTGADPNLTVLFDVDGTRRLHEFDLSRIERPVALRAFLQNSSVYNRFALSDPFDPGAWLHCSDVTPDDTDDADITDDTDDSGDLDGAGERDDSGEAVRCEVLDTPSSPTDRPVLPHEDPDTLVTPP